MTDGSTDSGRGSSDDSTSVATRLSDDLVRTIRALETGELQALSDLIEEEISNRATENPDDDGEPTAVSPGDTDAQADRPEQREDSSTVETTDRPDELDDRPDEVPGKATVVIKTINDNRYYYWQWREGEKVKSKYAGPVNG
jgi:hypothetical protein